MPRSGERGPTESGVLVYPKMPVPKRESDPRMPRAPRTAWIDKKRVVLVAILLVAGAVAGFFLRPMVTTDPRIGELETQLAGATTEATELRDRATKLEGELETLATAKQQTDKQLAEAQRAEAKLATQAEQQAARTKRAKAVRAKLRRAAIRAISVPALAGEDVVLRIPDRLLFKRNDATLTRRGKQVLARLANPLKELGDREIWIAGHTDDTPIPLPKAPKASKPPRQRRGQKPPPAEPPAPKFATNWELSAARALAVVHYFQDVAKLDPKHLAARAHSQYHPVGRSKALNRRLEIIVAPRPAD